MRNEIVNKIANIITLPDNLSESHIVHLMVLMRKLIDNTNEKDIELLEFFCNWSVHIDMDRTAALHVIEKLNKIISNIKTFKDKNLVSVLISGAISFKDLRTEIKYLLKKNSINVTIFDNDYFWKNFAVNLIKILQDCPIHLSQNLTKKKDKIIIENIKANPIKLGCWVTQVSLKENTVPIWGGLINLYILHSDSTVLVVPFKFE
ncbi:MAG: hypothetical protein WC414_00640 [Patescibacteria group bacterium]|jgi:hypothetical protein